MSRSADLEALIREHSRPATPRRPPLPPELHDRSGSALPRYPRAVLFDVYGTLFTSASGDISLSTPGNRRAAVAVALQWARWPRPADAARLAGDFRAAVLARHLELRQSGVLQPEVDVREIWARVFSERGIREDSRRIERFALLFELAANPVWPMPGAATLADRLRAAGLPLGIVSNAQFYTPLLFPALLGRSAEALGFEPSLIAYSYEAGCAKPDPRIFERPLAALAEQGIDSSEVVYVGNDMINDVATAAAAGCMTVLFAGDARSLRLGRSLGLLPDAVVRSLSEVCVLACAPEEEK